jgi:hypothetical protein
LTHGLSSLSSVLAMTIRFRMIAVMASFARYPGFFGNWIAAVAVHIVVPFWLSEQSPGLRRGCQEKACLRAVEGAKSRRRAPFQG